MDQDEQAGRLPFRLWIGVTGHRELPADPELVEQVREVLGRVRGAVPASDATPLRLGVVSSLAEGADRLVAGEVLGSEGALLEVPLPLPRHEYVRDFASQGSREEFAELLARASLVTVVPDMGAREETYAEAGRLVVDRCDALVAIWDGAPSRGVGGTADAVVHARARRVPVYWIRTGGEAGYELVEEPGNGLPLARFGQVDRYNRARVPPGDLATRVEAETGRLRAEAERAGLPAGVVEPALAWYLPFLARADALSLRLQRRYHRLGMALFVLAALAAVAGGASIKGWSRQLTVAQVLLLLVPTGLSVNARYRQLPARWISCRLLAEQLRAAMFLTVAGLEPGRDRSDLLDPSVGWVQAASAEVCLRGPRGAPPATAAGELRRFLLGGWVDHQLGYLRRTGERQRRRDGVLGTAVSWLFLVTLVLTLAKAFLAGDEPGGPGVALALFLSALPALGAAFSGVREQRQYVRNSERSLRVSGHLERLRIRLSAAKDLGSVQELAMATAVLLSDENRDWFGVMGAGNLTPAP